VGRVQFDGVQDVLDDGVTLPVEMLSYPSVIIGTEAWNVDHGEAVEPGRPTTLTEVVLPRSATPGGGRRASAGSLES
jgi:hypothetical protein